MIASSLRRSALNATALNRCISASVPSVPGLISSGRLKYSSAISMISSHLFFRKYAAAVEGDEHSVIFEFTAFFHANVHVIIGLLVNIKIIALIKLEIKSADGLGSDFRRSSSSFVFRSLFLF